jgi:hypothetical protein
MHEVRFSDGLQALVTADAVNLGAQIRGRRARVVELLCQQRLEEAAENERGTTG